MEGEDEGRTVLQKVMQFCIGSAFERDFEDFAQKNKEVFLRSLEMDEKAEHPLEFHGVYLDYLRKFEAKIERFIEGMGCSTADFYKQARELLERDPAVESDPAVRFFLEALLATSEYENFVALMKGEMHKYKSDAPETKIDDCEGKSSHK